MKKRILAVFFSLVGVFLLGGSSVSAASINDTQCTQNALYGSYYRIPVVNDANRTVAPSDPILFSDDQLLLKSNDTMGNFQTPQTMERKFPNVDTIPGQPQYFAVRWHGTRKVSQDKDYRIMLSSHEASQLYINGALVVDVQPNANFGGKTISMHLPQGDAVVDIFFAKRSAFTSGLVFSVDGTVSFSPCAAAVALQTEAQPVVAVVSTPTPALSPATPTTQAVLGASVQNRAPHFVAFNPTRTVPPQKPYTYMVVGSDPDRDLMTYRLVTAPAGMTITPYTGFILWNPTQEQRSMGPQLVTVEIKDETHTTRLGYVLQVNVPVNNSVLSRNTDSSGVTGKTNSQNASSISIPNQPAQEMESTASAGNRLFASAFFTGMFNAFRWVKHNMLPLALGIFFFVVAAVIAYGALEIVERAKLARRRGSANPPTNV
jgi:hypothetical protein